MSFNAAGMYIELAKGTFAVSSLNVSRVGGVLAKENNFSFVGGNNVHPSPSCPLLGDVTIRVAPNAGDWTGKGAGGTAWAIFDSAFGDEGSWGDVVNATVPGSIAAHDITVLLNTSTRWGGYNNSIFPGGVPVRVVRSWSQSEGVSKELIPRSAC
jgi:hypothetical protein